MELFNLIVGTCSIVSLIVSLMALKKVNNINKQKIEGHENIMSGRDIHVK